MNQPLFSPASIYWRVNREWIIALAGPRALLLELAHPAIAAAVAQHSNFRGDPFGRLYRTIQVMTEISFGTPDERAHALRHFHKCHARVRTSCPASVAQTALCPVKGPLSFVAYDARDPHLQFWVLATLMDSVLRVYEKFVMPLSSAEQSAYYGDCVRLARVLGIPDRAVPSSMVEFDSYMNAMVSGNELAVTPNARAIVDALFARNLRGRATRLFSAASVGMLPPRLRAAYGFDWSERRQKYLERLAACSRRARPFIPNVLAIHPKAYAMERLSPKWGDAIVR